MNISKLLGPAGMQSRSAASLECLRLWVLSAALSERRDSASVYQQWGGRSRKTKDLVQGHPWLYIGFEAGLLFVRSCFKEKRDTRDEVLRQARRVQSQEPCRKLDVELQRWLSPGCSWTGPSFSSQNPHLRSQPKLQFPGIHAVFWSLRVHLHTAVTHTHSHKIEIKEFDI